MAQRNVMRFQRHRGREPFAYADFRFDERGMTLVGIPTSEEWSECLEQLIHVEKNVHFWIGDLLVYGEQRWGEETYTEMIEATGYDRKTLDKLKWVASRVDASRRRGSLSFSHHQEVAGLPVDQQEIILASAVTYRWTSEIVHHEVNRLKHEAKRPAGVPLVSGLHRGDCREVMAMLPGESIDLLIADPPTDGPKALSLVDDVLRCAFTKLKPNSHVYVFTTWERHTEIAAIVTGYFDLRTTLLWIAQNRVTEGSETNYRDQDEVILFAHKGRRHLNGSRDGNVLYFDDVPTPKHPAEKPVALLQYLIEKSTQEKEMVLDPFMGSGSSCVAARDVRRRYIGIEVERQWYEEAQRRLALAAAA